MDPNILRTLYLEKNIVSRTARPEKTELPNTEKRFRYSVKLVCLFRKTFIFGYQYRKSFFSVTNTEKLLFSVTNTENLFFSVINTEKLFR
jgi:hypothetical protein